MSAFALRPTIRKAEQAQWNAIETPPSDWAREYHEAERDGLLRQVADALTTDPDRRKEFQARLYEGVRVRVNRSFDAWIAALDAGDVPY